MKLIVEKNDWPEIIIWCAWAAIMFMCISLVTGSYVESEPIAGQRFGIVAVLWALTGPVVYVWRKKKRASR